MPVATVNQAIRERFEGDATLADCGELYFAANKPKAQPPYATFLHIPAKPTHFFGNSRIETGRYSITIWHTDPDELYGTLAPALVARFHNWTPDVSGGLKCQLAWSFDRPVHSFASPDGEALYQAIRDFYIEVEHA